MCLLLAKIFYGLNILWDAYLIFIVVPWGSIARYCNNQVAIHNTKNKKMASNSKHIVMYYNHIRVVTKKGIVALEYLPTIKCYQTLHKTFIRWKDKKNHKRYGTITDSRNSLNWNILHHIDVTKYWKSCVWKFKGNSIIKKI